MNQIFDEFFDLLLNLEGGFSDRKSDRGGKTKYGITQTLLNSIAKRDRIPPLNVYEINIDNAKSIYLNEFFNVVKPTENKEFYYNLFDICVNSGYANYRILFRRIQDLGGLDDNSILYDQREKFYKGICNGDLSQNANFKGWMNRLNRIQEYFKKQNQTKAA